MQESSKKGDKNDIKNTSHSINKKSRRQNVYDLENTLCCLHKIDDIENNAFTRFFALQQIIAMLFSFSLFSKDYLYITINITLCLEIIFFIRKISNFR